MVDQVVKASWRTLGFSWVLKIGRAHTPGEVREGLAQRGEWLEPRGRSRSVQSMFRKH